MTQIRARNHFKSQIPERNRIVEKLLANQAKKVILITGFPAQGKSTLAFQYIQHIRSEFLRITLDVTDSIPLYFCQTILTAAEKSLSLSDHKQLKDGLCEIIDASTSTQTIAHYQRWVMTLIRKIEYPVVIVFDNLEKLKKNTKTLRIIEALMSSVPENIQLIIISRWLPQLKFQRYILEGLAVLLTDRDLRLSVEEFKICWQSFFGRSLPIEKATRMFAKTNGWIGALALIASGLNAKISNSSEAYFDKILDGNLPAEFILYLQQEAFGSLSETHQKFLCKIASLRRMYPSDMLEIFEDESVISLMEQTLSMNLFIDKFTDRDKQPYYKFNHFYRSFLLEKQKQFLSRKQRNRINYRAAQFYENTQRPEMAIELYLKAGRRKEAKNLIKSVGIKLIKKRRFQIIDNWIAYFDDSEIKDDHLLYFLKFITQPRKDIAIRDGLPDQFIIKFFKSAKLEEALVLMSLTLESIILTGKHHTSADYLLQYAYNLLKNSEVNQYPEACAQLWLKVGIVNIYATGEIVKGIVACDTARRMGQLTNSIFIEVEAAAIESIGNALLGRISKAKKSFLIFKKLFSSEDYRLKSIGIVGECVINLIVDTPETFDGRIHQLITALEEGHMWCLGFYVVLLKFVRMISLEQFAAAEELVESIDNLLYPLPNPIWEYHLAFLKARLKYLQNDMDSARQLITKTIQTKPDLIKAGGIHYAHANLLAGIIDFRLGSPLTSRKYLQKAMVVFETLGATISKCETALILGALEVTSGQTTAGKQKLKLGIDLVNKKKNSSFFVLRHVDVALSVCIAFENKVPGAVDCIQLLVKKERYRPVFENLLKKRTAYFQESMQNSIKSLHKSIYRAGLKKIYIKTLGDFSVRKGEHFIEEKQWGGALPVNVLKAIISKGCYNVPKDLLMEELWPKLDPSAMERAYKVALHRLRKSLEPTMLRRYGSSYIHFRHNLISLDTDLVIIDFIEYTNAVKHAYQLSIKGELDAAWAIHNKADQIYAGPFLPSDQYAQWASERRESLNNMRIEQLIEIAQIQEARDQKKSAVEAYEKVLLYDQFNESALQKLMIHCKAIDCKPKAIKAFCNFKSVLEKELNLVPAEATEELYQSIVATKLPEVSKINLCSKLSSMKVDPAAA